MDRNTVLETMYKVIKESLAWGIDSRDNSYGHFLDGVVAVTETLLKEEENSDC